MEIAFRTRNLTFYRPLPSTNYMLYAETNGMTAIETDGHILYIPRRIENPGWTVGVLLKYQAGSYNACFPARNGEAPWFMPEAFPETGFQEIENGQRMMAILLPAAMSKFYSLNHVVSVSDEAKLPLADSVWVLDQILAVYELLYKTNYHMTFRPERFLINYEAKLILALDLSGAKLLREAEHIALPAISTDGGIDPKIERENKEHELELWRTKQELFSKELVKIARMTERITDDIHEAHEDKAVDAYCSLVVGMKAAVMIDELASDKNGIIHAVRKILRQVCGANLAELAVPSLETL